MTTPSPADHDDLRHAEYVLGVLDADERAGVEREMRDDPQAVARVEWWQQRLTPLSEEVAASVPPEYVWVRIQDALGHGPETAPASSSRAPRRRWWNSLPLWRGWGLAATAVAVVCLVVLFTVPRPAQKPAATEPYMVSSIQQTNDTPGWNATMDVAHARMIVTRSGDIDVPADRSTELWLIPPDHKPISVGLIPDQKAAVMHLPDDLVARLDSESALAVSVEPPGGSPTGQPTGPVIAKGGISQAPLGGATGRSG